MSLHDHAVADALNDALAGQPPGTVVGVMGGHGVERGSEGYEAAARLGLALTRAGRTVLTGRRARSDGGGEPRGAAGVGA